MILNMNLAVICLVLMSCFGAYNSSTMKAVFGQEYRDAKPRLVMRGTLPSMAEFTICHWVDTHIWDSVIKDTSYIMTYHSTNLHNVLHTGFKYVNKEKYFALSMGNEIAFMMDQTASFKFNLKDGQWHHICVSWSMGGQVNFYLNGIKMSASDSIGIATAYARGGVLIIGDGEPTTNGTLGWLGNIADLHIWDESLHENQILSLAKCEKQLEGNVFAWMKSSLSAFDGVILSKLNELCVY